jgi:hypothetical protein
VVQSADLRYGDDGPAGWPLYFSGIGALVVKGLMRTRSVVVREIPAQQAPEMPFVDHDDVIEAFSTNRADDALGEGILPGRSQCDEDLAHPQTLHPACEHIAVDGIPIADQIRGRRLLGEALDQLVCSPRCSRVVGDVDMDEFSTVVSKNQEPEEQAEGECGDGSRWRQSRRYVSPGRFSTSRKAAAGRAACTWQR